MKRDWLGEQRGDMPQPLWVVLSLVGMLIAVFGLIDLASRLHR